MRLRAEFKKIVFLFLGWRLLLILVAILAVNFVPLGATDRFLGGGPDNYQLAPAFFSWANFDGEHYLSISIFGYKDLEQAFFPVYPKLINIITGKIAATFPLVSIYNYLTIIFTSTFVGLIISNLFFLLSLILLFDLINLDYPERISFLTIIMLLFFPTSFYFGSLYSESIFLFLLIATFYSARKRRWWLAGVLGALASATRIFGILLIPALIIEIWQQKEDRKKLFWLLLVPAGFLSYMFYQWQSVGDPLAFYNLQKIVGEQHQSGIILFPHVIFRYLKMIYIIDINNPIYQTIILEFISGISFLFLHIYGYFKKIRLSYLFFSFFAFVLPTVQGSFSSLPRYVLILFPSFLAFAIVVDKVPKLVRVIIFLMLGFLLILETALFLRGYWVA